MSTVWDRLEAIKRRMKVREIEAEDRRRIARENSVRNGLARDRAYVEGARRAVIETLAVEERCYKCGSLLGRALVCSNHECYP